MLQFHKTKSEQDQIASEVNGGTAISGWSHSCAMSTVHQLYGSVFQKETERERGNSYLKEGDSS